MLGLTSYQEALRALGPLLEPASYVRIVEYAAGASVLVTTPRGAREYGAAELEEIVVASHTRRGGIYRATGSLSDVLRAVGLALDELHALDVRIDLVAESLHVRFSDRQGSPHDLNYAGDELDALRRSAAARRNGQPLRRVLIFQASPESGAPIVELLVAEFAVQALPVLYARAVARATVAPDLVLLQSRGDSVLDAIRELRSGRSAAHIPIVILAAEDSHLDTEQIFDAGADDLLLEPVLPAQLRARLRTWLLRGRLHSE
jgi:CheY-like chemotaxis protein